MAANNISLNNKELLKQKNNIFNIRKIRSKYVLKQIFEHLNQKIFLKIIKHNKNIQNILEINQNDYKKFCEIEIEIIPTEDKDYEEGLFIFFNNKEEKSYYHIYYDNSKEEAKRKHRNYKVIIDYQIKSFENLFNKCKFIKKINFIKFNRNDINNMSYMFYGCESLTELNLLNFNTNNVTNMDSMFGGCKSLKELNLSNFNTNNVTNMKFMFCGCNSLKELNLSNFNTINVNNMTCMFSGCSSLKNLNLINFKINKSTDMFHMFYKCLSIEELNISKTFYIGVKNHGDICMPKKSKLKIKA